MATKIKQPSDVKISGKGCDGILKFNTNFAANKTAAFHKAQMFIDSEVLRLDDPLVPLQTGNLKRSGQLGTEIGSGEVKYNAVYASYQYWSTAETRSYDAQRGGKWFERMKSAHKDEILKGAKAKFG